jgi:MFS family permease
MLCTKFVTLLIGQSEYFFLNSAVSRLPASPARLDRLPWTSWHLLIVIALGITWLLDGLETNLGGALAGILKSPKTLGLSDAQIGLSATVYLAGAVTGALVFGYATDRLGRRKLFFLTLLLYVGATAATAFSWNFWSFSLFRGLTGAGIGGEYAAINSAVDELIPARLRGRVDLIVNGTFWVGAALGSLMLGHLFDSLGRRLMITTTYAGSSALLAATTWLFARGQLSLTMQAVAWSVVFFVASPAASSAYLTVSEIFPLEIRGLAIAVFYALGTLLGGVAAPALFGALTQSNSRQELFWGYLGASALMAGGGLMEWKMGIAAERKSLESITAPLASADEP